MYRAFQDPVSANGSFSCLLGPFASRPAPVRQHGGRQVGEQRPSTAPFQDLRGTDRNPPAETLGCWKPVDGETGAAYRRTSGVQTGVSLSGSFAISTAV